MCKVNKKKKKRKKICATFGLKLTADTLNPADNQTTKYKEMH